MSRLSFDDSTESFDENTITNKELFSAVIALMQRMERIEIIVGEIINLTMEPYTADGMPEEIVSQTIEHMTQFTAVLANELRAHHEVRQHMVFLNQPE